MKRRLIVTTLTLGMLLAAATSAFAQSEGSSDAEIPADAGNEASPLPTLTINSVGGRVPVGVEIADTDAERQTGLMGRTVLPEDAGMLFVFEGEQAALSFWMRDTLIPLSIAYIDAQGRIVDIQDMEPLDDVPPHYVSAEPARYALEVNQGFFEERGVTVGDLVELPVQGEETPDGALGEEV